MIKSTAIPSAIGDIDALSATLAGKLAAASNLSDLASAATARSNLSLGNVDNTSDANKPVSTAQQTALNLKANVASPALTGAVTIAGGTVTDPAYALDISQTWDDAADTFTAFRVSVTDTASASPSKLLDAQVGGASKFAVRKTGATLLGSSASSPVLIPSDGMLGVNRRDNSTTLPLFSVGQYSRTSATIVSGGFFGWSASASDTSGGNHTPDTALARTSAGLVEFNSGTAGTLRDWKARRGSLTEYLDIVETTAPAAPPANTARLYVEDDGAGKTRLMVLFPTGAAQQIAIEP